MTHPPQLAHHAVSSRLGGSTGKTDKKETTGVGCFGDWPQQHKCVGPDLCQAAVEDSGRELGEARGRAGLRQKGERPQTDLSKKKTNKQTTDLSQRQRRHERTGEGRGEDGMKAGSRQ